MADNFIGHRYIFRWKKIPELMRGLGSGVREFKKASSVDNPDDTTKDKKREEA